MRAGVRGRWSGVGDMAFSGNCIMPRIVLLVMGLSLIVSGCKNRTSSQASTNQGGKPGAAVATPPAGEGAPTSSQTSPASGPSSLQAPLGVYSISEVDRPSGNENVVAEMIPGHREIQISFKSDGSFMRVSWKANLVQLNETGTFKVEAPDQLILFPTTFNKKPVTDGRKSGYKFALSADGYELKLWGATKGNIAVFHRIKTL